MLRSTHLLEPRPGALRDCLRAGAKDPLCLEEHPLWFKENIPGARDVPMHVLPDGKHNLHLRFADEVNELVRQFAKQS